MSAYTYKVEHKPSNQHSIADDPSQLPLEVDTEWTDESQETVFSLEQQQLNHLSRPQIFTKKPFKTLYSQNFKILQCVDGLMQ